MTIEPSTSSQYGTLNGTTCIIAIFVVKLFVLSKHTVVASKQLSCSFLFSLNSMVVRAGQSVSLSVEVYVTKESAPKLNDNSDKLEDILVLHLDGEKISLYPFVQCLNFQIVLFFGSFCSYLFKFYSYLFFVQIWFEGYCSEGYFVWFLNCYFKSPLSSRLHFVYLEIKCSLT